MRFVTIPATYVVKNIVVKANQVPVMNFEATDLGGLSKPTIDVNKNLEEKC